STLSSIYVGASAGMVFGPLGAVIGSVAGYMVASSVYNSCLAILRSAQLTEEESQRLQALCAESIEQLREESRQIQSCVDDQLKAQREFFDETFHQLGVCTARGDHEGILHTMTDLAQGFGIRLCFENFEEFDRFMLESESPLQLGSGI
ncbi:MAG: hypothetical protein ACLFV4_11545, partial [Candidatus Hydrogenedentota bacterium]